MRHKINSQAEGGAWVRKEGWFAGVCEGLADRFDISSDLLRLGWVIAFFIFGVGLFVYIGLAIALPREGRLSEAYKDKFLGVCYRLHRRCGIDLGLIRFTALLLAVSSLGSFLIVYLAMWLFLPEPNESYY